MERYTRARAIQADRMAEEIGEFGYDAAGNPKIKLADKRGALVDLGRHFALFTDRLDANIVVTHIDMTFGRPGGDG